MRAATTLSAAMPARVDLAMAVLVFAALAIVAAMAGMPAASASELAEEGAPLHISCEGAGVLDRLLPARISVACDPASIEVGISCGMADMCGENPCLCGSSDAWGDCACNGLQTLEPTVTYASGDESVVRIVVIGGKAWLVPMGSGHTTVEVHASLKHFTDADALLEVDVNPISAPEVLAIMLAIAAVAALVVRGVRHAHARKETDPGDEG